MTEDETNDVMDQIMKDQQANWRREREREMKFFAYRDAAIMACGALRAMGAKPDVIEAIESRLPIFGEA